MASRKEKESPKKHAGPGRERRGTLDPGRTPGTAEGDEPTVDKALRDKERKEHKRK